MSNMKRAFERVKEAWRNDKEFHDTGDMVAGREAEYEVRKLINRRIHGTGWRVFSSIRVPDQNKKVRREFDFVITAPDRAYMLELKNWSGSIELVGDVMVQHRRYDAGTIDHGPLLQDVEYRARLLASLVDNQSSQINVIPILVFYNDNLDIPDDIRAHPSVITYTDLKGLLPAPSELDVGLIEAILVYLGLRETRELPEPPASEGAIMELQRALENLGTWDVLEFNGSKISFGDVISRTQTDHRFAGKSITDRASVASIDLSVPRSIISAIFSEPSYSLELSCRDRTSVSVSFPQDSFIYFQPAGAKEPEKVFLRSLKRIEFGYITKHIVRYGWNDLTNGLLINGKVKSVVVGLGVFLEAGAPVDAFIHESEFKGVSVELPSEGDCLEARVKYVNKNRQRLALELV